MSHVRKLAGDMRGTARMCSVHLRVEGFCGSWDSVEKKDAVVFVK